MRFVKAIKNMCNYILHKIKAHEQCVSFYIKFHAMRRLQNAYLICYYNDFSAIEIIISFKLRLLIAGPISGRRNDPDSFTTGNSFKDIAGKSDLSRIIVA